MREDDIELAICVVLAVLVVSVIIGAEILFLNAIG